MGTTPCTETPPPKFYPFQHYARHKWNVMTFSDIINIVKCHNIPASFSFLEWNQEIFPGYKMKPGNFSGLQNKNLIFSGTFRNFQTWFWKFQVYRIQVTEKFRFPFLQEISRNSTLRNKFPEVSYM